MQPNLSPLIHVCRAHVAYSLYITVGWEMSPPKVVSFLLGSSPHVIHNASVEFYMTATGQSARSGWRSAGTKTLKYAELSAACEFQPMAVETHRSIDKCMISFVTDLGRRFQHIQSTHLMIGCYFSVPVCWFYVSIQYHEPFSFEHGIDA